MNCGEHYRMNRVLQSDLDQLQKLAFRRVERCGALLKEFHDNKARINSNSAAPLIWRVYDWLCVPLSLWPIDFEGFAQYLLGLIERKKPFDSDLLWLLKLIGEPPDKETCETVGAFEHLVEIGNYDELVKRPEKFKEHEDEVKRDEELAKNWKQIKKRWDVTSFQNTRGVIRRRMSQERNFRGDWDFDWKNVKQKFHLFFDAICYRWKLYGMQHDDPLLLKISVNPTPHGTMIVIPRHWSLDLARDLHWNKIGRLHKAHGAIRQGPKLSVSRIQKHREAHEVLMHWNDAGNQGKRGDSRYDYVHEKMKKDGRTDQSWVKRHLRIARSQTRAAG